MDILRATVPSYEEVLERILDRGIVLDGLSSLAALSKKLDRRRLHVTAYCPLEGGPEKPSAVRFPPRKRQRA